MCRVAFSGGSTPIPMFGILATLAVDWQRMTVFQVDERVAPDGDDDRNASSLCAALLDRVDLPAGARLLMPVTAVDIERAAIDYGALIDAAQLDIVHLGLGDDGHTASWPPGDPVVTLANSVAVTGLFNGRRRMTFTRGPVNSARSRIVEVVGESKALPIAQWLLHDSHLPIEHVRRGNTTVVLDEAAASALPASAFESR